jgi:hypothetical protein
MDEEARLTFLAANYGNLRSLRMAPLYALFIAEPWLDFHRIARSLAIAWVGVCIVWFSLLGAYYTRRYGRVESSPAARRKPNFWKTPENLVLLLYPVTVLCGLALKWIQYHGGRDPAPAFLFAGLILGWGMTSSNISLRRSYYIAANASAILLALAVIFRSTPGHLFFSAYAETFLGVILLTLGILDHLVLRRTFRQEPRHVYA